MESTIAPDRYSGHETFVCRYAWLPKVVGALCSDPALFRDEAQAMVTLGIGKNMVRSAKFWAEAAQIIEDCEGGSGVTRFGMDLLHHDGYDPYLERAETLWLLHWKISTNLHRPLFHWRQMLNHWHRPEFSESEAIRFLEGGLPAGKAPRSKRTLSDGFKVFVNSYVPSRGKKGEIAEDNLDCPLTELRLVRYAGQRLADDGHREPIYRFNQDPKPTISPELLAYCLWEFWTQSTDQPEGDQLPFRVICSDSGSPGQVFKLRESALVALLESLSSVTKEALVFEESRSMQQVWERKKVSPEGLLSQIYRSE